VLFGGGVGVVVEVVVVVVAGCVVVVVGAPVVVVADGAQGFLVQEPGPMSVPPSWLQWSGVNCPHASRPLSMRQQRVLLAGACWAAPSVGTNATAASIASERTDNVRDPGSTLIHRRTPLLFGRPKDPARALNCTKGTKNPSAREPQYRQRARHRAEIGEIRRSWTNASRLAPLAEGRRGGRHAWLVPASEILQLVLDARAERWSIAP